MRERISKLLFASLNFISTEGVKEDSPLEIYLVHGSGIDGDLESMYRATVDMVKEFLLEDLKVDADEPINKKLLYSEFRDVFIDGSQRSMTKGSRYYHVVLYLLNFIQGVKKRSKTSEQKFIRAKNLSRMAKNGEILIKQISGGKLKIEPTNSNRLAIAKLFKQTNQENTQEVVSNIKMAEIDTKKALDLEKSSETKGLDIKIPEDTKSKAVENQANAKTVETKPVEVKTAEVKPVETKLPEVKPVEAKPVEIKPIDTRAPEVAPAFKPEIKLTTPVQNQNMFTPNQTVAKNPAFNPNVMPNNLNTNPTVAITPVPINPAMLIPNINHPLNNLPVPPTLDTNSQSSSLVDLGITF